MSDIFNEVDEEVRREQLKKLWERYGNLIVAAAILVVVAVAGWRGYQWWEGRKAAAAGAAYDAAQQLADAGKHSEAEEAFAKLAADGTPGYRLLARLREAAELAPHDAKAAVAAYDNIAGETGQPLLAQLATIRAALLLVDTAKFDEMNERLQALAQPSSPFRHTARELLALSAWRNGDAAATRTWVDTARADPEVPQGVRARLDVLPDLLADAPKP